MTDRTNRHLWMAKVEYVDGDIGFMENELEDIVVTKTRWRLWNAINLYCRPLKAFGIKKITPFKFYPCKRPEFGSIGPEKKK